MIRVGAPTIMSALRAACQNPIDLLESIAELASYLLLFVRAFLSRSARSAATIVALSSQLAEHQRRGEHNSNRDPASARPSGASGSCYHGAWRAGRTSPL